MISPQEFPRLTPDNYRVVSSPTANYNCIAWSAGDTSHWWQPGVFWPTDAASEDCNVPALQRAFNELGYTECPHGELEPRFEKVALFGDGMFYTHAARQLPDGKWTSKLGRAQDIEHDTPEDVAGGIYGSVAVFMKRPISQPPS
jgi:hypothetical protein